MKTLKQLMSAVILSVIASTAVAQTTETTPNLITNTWSGTTNYTGAGGGTSGGASAGYNSSTGTIYFGYTNQAAWQAIAINNALQGTGIQVNGYNWGWDINNLNYDNRQGATDTLTASIFTQNSAGQNIHTFTQTYNTKFDWTRFSGTQTYANPYLATDLGNLQIQFNGMDSGYWAGYYGPQVRNVSLSLNYGVDQCVVNPQSSPTCPGYRTYYNMWDDGYAQVDLPFTFPFYGQNFTTSYMFTNGVVGFLSTNTWGYCCDGTDLNQQAFSGSPSWNFSIYALNTDLYPGQNSQFYTQKTDNGTGLKYTWENVVEIGTNLENTFSVNIKDSGYIGINYEKVNLNPWRNPLIGIAGDISQGQYSQYYYGPASNLPNLAGTTLQYTGTETTDICTVNPLANPSCPGYAVAYFNQQCSINALYDTTCPGYAAAYLTYQCNISQLYSPSCPGYQQAYLDQQCGINPLYSSSCAGYQTASTECAADPLYASYCPGYTTAVNECSTNGLLHTYCPTYQTELNYCSTDPLFNTLCSGYTAASNACSANQLTYTYCPNYTTALAACSTNPQGNTMCPGYTSTASSGETTVVATTSESAATPAIVSDPIVNEAVTATATSASPAQAATATVPLVAAPTTTTAVAAVVETKTEEKKEETKAVDSDSSKEEKKEETKTADSSSSSASTASTSSEQKKDQPKTMRQQIQEQRVAAARAKAVEAGKELANKMGEAASLEAQIAVQNVVIAAMGFTPGFDTYNRAVLFDAVGYKPFEIYKGQRNVDNPAGRRFLTGADHRHQEMVDQQYNRSE